MRPVHFILMLSGIVLAACGGGGGATADTPANPSVTIAPTHPVPVDTSGPAFSGVMSVGLVSGDSVTLQWPPATDNVGVVGYTLTRNGSNFLVNLPGSTLSFVDTGLQANTTYTYTLVAKDAAGNASTPIQLTVLTSSSGTNVAANPPTTTTPPPTVAPPPVTPPPVTQPTAPPAVPDTTKPAFSGSMAVTATSSNSVSLQWPMATDNIGVSSYALQRNGSDIGGVLYSTTTTYTDTGLTSGTAYTYTVVAKDAAGNVSSPLQVVGRTLAAGGPTVVSLNLDEQPFGTLQLVDEIDTATMAPNQEIPASTSGVRSLLGRNARTIPLADTARVVTYRLGQGKGLVAKQAYVLDIEYPDDVPRAMFIANRGADFVRGFATGSAIGDVRLSYTVSTLESIAYPQTGVWKNYRSLFYLHERFSPVIAQRNAACANRILLPADGFDVSVFQASSFNDPRSNGLALGKIRLYKVVNPSALPAVINYPASLARRHVYWREEMSDEAVDSNILTKRAVANPIDWFAFKMDLGRALGFNTVGKNMMVWGYNQGFDSGDYDWMFNAQPPLSNIWSQMVAQAAIRNLYLFPYLEYGGSAGGNCSGGLCDKSVGNYKSMGFQRRTEKLFHGVYPANGEGGKDAYTEVGWTEYLSADLTDPDTLTDFKKVMDRLLVQYKGQASFMGTWLRMRQTKLPMSFSSATVARYNADNPGDTRTIAQLRSTESSRGAYYNWWYGKRRIFLLAVRDYIRTQMGDNSLQVHFSAYADEPVPSAYDPSPTEISGQLELISDDPTWWSNYANSLPNLWFKWHWAAKAEARSVSDRVHRNGLNLFKRPYNSWQSNWPEYGHSTPPADPLRYQADDGIAMTMEFGNGLYTVDDAALLGEYSNGAGASLMHHYPLNEDNGATFQDTCTDHMGVSESDAFNAKAGYLAVAVERGGPYSVIAEARALANGNPINIGYMEPSSISRGFPAYVRRFNQALLSLPAIPLYTLSGVSDNGQVVVRKTAVTVNGTYYAVVNPSLQAQSQVTLTFPAASVKDLLTQTTHANNKLKMDFYPGEVRTFLTP